MKSNNDIFLSEFASSTTPQYSIR